MGIKLFKKYIEIRRRENIRILLIKNLSNKKRKWREKKTEKNIRITESTINKIKIRSGIEIIKISENCIENLREEIKTSLKWNRWQNNQIKRYKCT